MAREISPDSKTKMTDKKKKAIVRESNLSTDQVIDDDDICTLKQL